MFLPQLALSMVEGVKGGQEGFSRWSRCHLWGSYEVCPPYFFLTPGTMV